MLAALALCGLASALAPTAWLRAVAFGGAAFVTAAALLVGAVRWRPVDRVPWLLFAVAFVAIGMGDVVLDLRSGDRGVSAGPAPADAFYAVAYLALIAGFVRLLRRRGPRPDRHAAIDAAILALGAAMPLWAFLIGPLTVDPAVPPAAKAVAIVYPVVDLALLALAAWIALMGGRRTAAGALLGVGIVALLAADAMFGEARATGRFVFGGADGAIWFVAYLAWGAAALSPSMRELTEPAPGRAARLSPLHLALLTAATLIGPLLLVAEEWAGLVADAGVIAAASAVVSVLVIARIAGLGTQLEGALLRFRSLVEQVPAVVYTASRDPVDRVTYVSPRMEETLGYAPEEVTARAGFIADLIHPDDRARVLAEAARTDASGEPFAAEYRLRAADGRWVWVRDEAVLAPGAGGAPTQWQGVLIDVSDLKRATEALRAAKEAAEEADRFKSQFLSMASHDLRTPLTSITGYVDLLLADAAGELNEEQREFLTIVQGSAQQLTALTSDLLDLARIEAGRLQLTIEPVDVTRAARRAARAVAPQAAAKGLALIAPAADGLPPAAADPNRLEQVLLNLVGNAVKFTERGGVTIATRRDGDAVEVAVADTGIGIAPEALPHVFDEFRQGDIAIEQRYGGTGLGLAIVRKLVEAQGGAIAVASAPGEGTTFTVRLPVWGD